MTDDIAVVGFSFKLPQDVNDVSSFWQVLQDRKNLMTEWPESRIKNGSFESSNESNVSESCFIYYKFYVCLICYSFAVGEVTLLQKTQERLTHRSSP